MLTREELNSVYHLNHTEKADNLPLFIELSALDDPLGHCWLALCYEHGIGVDNDNTKAFELCKRASDLDFPLGHYWLGWYYGNGIGVYHDVYKAIELYTRASDLDFPLGHCWLGWYYEQGIGVDKNMCKAIELYQRASDQDHPLGHCWVGNCYERGIGIGRDISKAIELYQRASYQNYIDGHLFLAKCYMDGIGVDQDVCKAIELYQRAGRQDGFLAYVILGQFYEYGKGVEIEIDVQKSIAFYKKALRVGGWNFVDNYMNIIIRHSNRFTLEELIEIKKLCIENKRLYQRDIIQFCIDKYTTKSASAPYMKLCKTAIDVWEQMTCPICLEELKDQDYLFMTICLHLYHRECVEKQKKCPMCRLELEEINC